ncbi:MAG TPA: cation:proton antiporter [Kofleriaceae bacterium]|nr:cation:proton antiporter [Kofleriaceae bacterium]
MHEVRTFLQDLALVFCVASVATILFQRLRQPVVLGYLLAGLIVGPHLPLPLFADPHRIEMLSQLGVILVIFSIGLDFNLSKLAKVLPTSGIAGTVQITAMLWLGYTVGQLAGWGSTESLFLGGSICISSTMVVSRVFSSRRETGQVVESALGLLVVQDLAAVILIAMFTTVASGAGLPGADIALLVGELGLFLLGLVAVGILVVPRLIREAAHRESSEVLLITSIGICFGFALVAQWLDYSVALGAFIAGSVVAESGRRRQVEHLVEPVRDLFAAVFFVSIGMLVDPRAMGDHWIIVLSVSLLVIVGQSLFITIGSFLSGRSLRLSIRTAMSLAQIGEFSFIIVGIGTAGGAVSTDLMAIIVGVAAITTFTTPYLIAVSNGVALLVERRLPRPLQTISVLYASWLEALRAPGKPRSKLRVPLILLVLDVVSIAAIIVASAIYRHEIATAISERLQLDYRAAGLVAMAGAFVLILPFVLGLARSVRRMGSALAGTAMPGAAQGALDLADAPRRAFIIVLELALALAALVPLVAFTAPFLPAYLGALVLLTLLGGLGVVFWRRANNLQGHVRAGSELILEVLNNQRRTDDASQESAETAQLRSLLPGLGMLATLQVAATSPAVNKSLAQVNLRALTGATVLAIQHGAGGNVGAPAGAEMLRAGDLLSVTGTGPAIERARRLLAGLPYEEAESAEEDEPAEPSEPQSQPVIP